jgi:hypothetical protein
MKQLVRMMLALCALAVLTIVVLLVFRYQNRPSVITALAVGPVAWAVLAAICLWWLRGRHADVERATTPEQAAAAADWLAGETAVRWHQEARARRIVIPAPASVRWRWGPDALTVSPGEAAAAPPHGTGPPPLPDPGRPGEILSSGVVTRLHDEVYARLPYGRLVLTGGPGSGKTGAMIMLLLAALESRAARADVARAQVPVPVWLTLGGWNPAAEPLAEWVTGTLNRDYPALRASRYGADVAGYLVRTGRVAIFLDGLDEMPADLRAAALRRLYAEARELRVVLTSRPNEFQLALSEVNLDHCAVIELRPIRAEAAAAYLLRGQAPASRDRWERIADYLRSNPDSVTARALDNPLTLSMARDTYVTRDPAPLIEQDRFPTVEALSGHLIDQFLVTAYPDEQERAHAIGWLAWIAGNLGTARDLRWWDIPRWVPGWRLRIARGLLAGLVTWPVVTLLAWLTYRAVAQALIFGPPGVASWAAPGIAAGLGAALLTGLVIKLDGGVVAARPRRRGGLLLAVYLVVGAVVSSAVGATGPTEAAVSYTVFVACGIMIFGWWIRRRRRTGPPISVTRRSQEWRRAWTTGPPLERPVVRVATGAFAAAFPGAVWGYLVGGFGNAATFGTTSGLYAVVLGAIPAWLWRNAHGGRLSGPWALAPRWPRPVWLAPLWLIVFPLVIPRWIGDWVTTAANAPFATPASTYRTDRRACAIYAGGFAAMIAVPACLVAVIAAVAAEENHPPPVTAAALFIGSVGAAVLITWCLAWLCAGQVSLIGLTQLVLRPSRGRVSFARLLDDAQQRQVLRQAGAVYQFRHAVLQTRLATMGE